MKIFISILLSLFTIHYIFCFSSWILHQQFNLLAINSIHFEWNNRVNIFNNILSLFGLMLSLLGLSIAFYIPIKRLFE